MITWLVEDDADKVFVEDRRAVIRIAKKRAKERGLPQRGFKLRVEEPSKSNLTRFLNGIPKEIAREPLCEVGVR